MILAIGGTPGSGKTTVAELLATAHGYVLVSAGRMFREMAAARGMDLDSLGGAAEADHTIDRELDRRVLEEVLRQDSFGNDVIVDGRIQGYLLRQRGIPCLRVWIDAPLDVRARRIAGREGKPVEAARAEIAGREGSERRRYKAVYGIDLDDLDGQDLVIDSADLTPEEVLERIRARVEG